MISLIDATINFAGAMAVTVIAYGSYLLEQCDVCTGIVGMI